MDTLFVFQILFISLLFASIIVSLNRMGMAGSGFVWYSIAIVIAIDVIIIINRSMYTNLRRDQTFWNKRHFDDDNTRESPIKDGGYVNTIRQQYGSKTNTCNCN
jgi:uncharacterized membrane protein